MDPRISGDNVAELVWLQSKSSLGELGLHGTGLEEAEITAAFGGRAVRELGSKFFEFGLEFLFIIDAGQLLTIT